MADTRQRGEDGTYLYIQWDVWEYGGPHTGPRFDGWELTYRIERHNLWEDDDWEEVADIEGERFWRGTAGGRGEWAYRVLVLAVSLGDRIAKCDDPYLSKDTVFLVDQRPPTADEMADLRERICEDVKVAYVEGSAEWNMVFIHWKSNAIEDNFWRDNGEVERFLDWGMDWGLNWRVDQQLDGEDTWTNAATQVLDVAYSPYFGGIWEGEALPGTTSYRVALVGVTVAEQVYPCKGDL